MACSSPLTVRTYSRMLGKKYTQTYQVSCGKCLCCRMEKQSQLQFLAQKELLDVYKSDLGASFVTFTYNEDSVPYRVQLAGYPTEYVVHGLKEAQEVCARIKRSIPNAEPTYTQTLVRSDLQKFFKRMRINMERDNCPIKFKHISAGEYGDQFGRPHYHCVFLGLTDVLTSKYTKKAWPYGIVDIGTLSAGGLRYVLKYCTKANTDADVKALRDSVHVAHPFLVHSIGLGKKWILDHLQELAEHPFFRLGNKEIPVPKYVRNFIQQIYGKSVFDSFQQKKRIEMHKLAVANGFPSENEYREEQAYLKERMLFASLTSQGYVLNRGILSRRPPAYWQNKKKSQKLCENLIKAIDI